MRHGQWGWPLAGILWVALSVAPGSCVLGACAPGLAAAQGDVPQGEAAADVAAPSDGESEPNDSRDQEARALFQAGRVAFSDGRFDDALRYFEQAHELSGRGALLFNIGTSADRLRQDERALEAFRGYLEAVPEAPNRREVEARIRVIEAELARRAAVVTPDPVTDPDLALLPADPEGPRDDGGGGVLSKWWFWTIVGVVVAGGVTGAVLATQSDSPGFVEGDDGVLIMTLGSR